MSAYNYVHKWLLLSCVDIYFLKLKEVRREVELSRRRSIKLKAQVDKLQESREGVGWSQHRETVKVTHSTRTDISVQIKQEMKHFLKTRATAN